MVGNALAGNEVWDLFRFWLWSLILAPGRKTHDGKMEAYIFLS